MIEQPLRHLIFTVGPVVFAGCTFNVGTYTGSASSESMDAVRTLHYESTESADVTLRGRSTAGNIGTATATIAGLVGAGERRTSEAFVPVWTAGAPNDYVVTVPSSGAPQGLWVEELGIDVPSATNVTLMLEDESLHASGLSGRLEASTTSGSMDVVATGVVELSATSGSIVVTASEGQVSAESGSIEVHLDGWVVARTESGSIQGVIGDGCSATAESGSIELSLTRPLTRDLEISVTSGSVTVLLPRDAPVHLDLATNTGSVNVALPSVTQRGRTYVGDVQGGGRLLHIRAESGSIEVGTTR